MTAEQALKSPGTRYFVRELLDMCAKKDIVDAIHDLEHAAAVLRERLNLMQSA